jgi:hypothetical protein
MTQDVASSPHARAPPTSPLTSPPPYLSSPPHLNADGTYDEEEEWDDVPFEAVAGMERPTRRPKVNKEDKLKLMLEYMREMRVSFPDLLEWYLTVNLRGNSTERRTRWAVDALCRPAVVGALRGRLPWAASIQDFDEELERLVGQPGFDSWDINKPVDEFDLHTSHDILSEHAPNWKHLLEQLMTSRRA